MAEDTDSLNLTDGQKTRLLQIALSPGEADAPANEDELRGDLLCDILREPLPAELPERAASFADRAAKPCSTFLAIAGPTLRELLLDSKTDVFMLRRIKEYAKTLGTEAESEVEKDVYLAVYFAAIAAASLFHSQQITEHSDTNVDRFLASFARLSWIPSDLAGLFGDAARNHRKGS
jgi:hypothetical protein